MQYITYLDPCREFLTGFRKRKKERKRRAEQQRLRKMKEAKREVKQQVRDRER